MAGTCAPTADFFFGSDYSDTGGSAVDVDQSGVTVVVAPGVTLTGKDHAVKLNDSSPARVENCGTMIGTKKDAINADGAGVVVINHGTMTGADEGVQGGDGLTLTNTGTIHGDDEGVTGGDGVIIDNAAGASITAIDDAVQVGENAQITNAGLIENIGDSTDPQDAIDLDSGSVINLATGVIRSTADAAIDFDGSSIDSSIVNRGLISGTTGIMVEKGLTGDAPNTAAQIVTNSGTIVGTAGLALDLGAGNDALVMEAGGSLVGGADFGTGDDTMSFLDLFVGLFGGAGALFDGGEGNDTVVFSTLSLANVTGAKLVDQVLNLTVRTGAGDFSMALTSWETFVFGKKSYTMDQVVAAVPLPAGMAMLLPALGLLGWVGRRRR